MDRLKLPAAPDPGTEEFDDSALAWEMHFHQIAAMDAEVDRASLAVLGNPPGFWREQLPAILKAIEAYRASNLAQPEGAFFVHDREQAERDSASCDLCSGSGWAEVFHRAYDGGGYVYDTASDGSEIKLRARFRMACICPLGRWFLANLERQASEAKTQQEREKLARQARCMAGVDRIVNGMTDYTLFDPTLPPNPEIPQTKDWRAHVKAWADSKKATV